MSERISEAVAGEDATILEHVSLGTQGVSTPLLNEADTWPD